jgi:hypothetical protein
MATAVWYVIMIVVCVSLKALAYSVEERNALASGKYSLASVTNKKAISRKLSETGIGFLPHDLLECKLHPAKTVATARHWGLFDKQLTRQDEPVVKVTYKCPCGHVQRWRYVFDSCAWAWKGTCILSEVKSERIMARIRAERHNLSGMVH